MAHILIVDDDAKFLEVLMRLLSGRGHKTTALESGEAALVAVSEQTFDLVISDIFMKPVSGLDFLTSLRDRHPPLPVILLTAFGTVESALEALKMGAFDYITKPFKIDDLIQTIEEALNADALVGAKKDAPDRVRPVVGQIVAESPSMREVCMMIERIAPTDVTVLFWGERGVGKQLAGRAIHELSSRSEAPFVVADCAEKSEDELILHLFGRTNDETAPGCFFQAQGGTLWLSEIGQLSMDFQELLAGVFKSKTIYQVGAEQGTPIDVRILAETAEDIQLALAERRFRPDLFARFAPIAVEIKPLRERREDILPLFYWTLQKDDPSIRLERDAEGALLHHAWPGNISELEEVVHHAIQHCTDKSITSQDLPDSIVQSTTDAPETTINVPGRARALKAFLRSKDVDPETALAGHDRK